MTISRIYYIIKDNKLDRLIDSRRVGSMMPSMAEFAETLSNASIALPSGEEITWISNIMDFGITEMSFH